MKVVIKYVCAIGLAFVAMVGGVNHVLVASLPPQSEIVPYMQPVVSKWLEVRPISHLNNVQDATVTPQETIVNNTLQYGDTKL